MRNLKPYTFCANHEALSPLHTTLEQAGFSARIQLNLIYNVTVPGMILSVCLLTTQSLYYIRMLCSFRFFTSSAHYSFTWITKAQLFLQKCDLKCSLLRNSSDFSGVPAPLYFYELIFGNEQWLKNIELLSCLWCIVDVIVSFFWISVFHAWRSVCKLEIWFLPKTKPSVLAQNRWAIYRKLKGGLNLFNIASCYWKLITDTV